jgi:hypothetical protein
MWACWSCHTVEISLDNTLCMDWVIIANGFGVLGHGMDSDSGLLVVSTPHSLY